MTIDARSLRIVHHLPAIRLADGGVVRAVLDWCRVFADRGLAVTLMTRDPTDVPAAWRAGAAGAPRVVVPPDANVLADADVLHLHGPWLPSNRSLAAAAASRGVPYVVTVHGMLDDWSMGQKRLKKRLYLAAVGRRFLDRAAAVHCTAEGELDQARRWFGNPRTAVIPNLVDLLPFQRLPGPAEAMALTPDLPPGPRLLFVGRLHEKKGVDVLLRAAGRLRDGGLAFSLRVAGTGDAAYDRRLRDLTAALGLADRVRFLGLVTGSGKASLYQSSDLLVLPTSQENFGLVLAEAMACGTPVVTTRGVDIWPELERGGATIVDPTPAAVAGAVAELVADRARLASLGDRGRRWAFETLAADVVAGRYEAWYRDVAGREPPRHTDDGSDAGAV